MKNIKRDTGLDYLLELDGTVLVIDPIGQHWVKFIIKRVECSPERPHGLNYSLTLHDADNERLVGFDNAHPVSEKKGVLKVSKTAYDHKHRFRTIKPYEYSDAVSLLEDFWKEVESVLKEREVKL